MSEVARIQDQLRRALDGDAWHGPALGELLRDVTAERAAARPLPGGHTIWEIVLHIATWEDVVQRRAEGEAVASVPDAVDWPLPAGGDGAAWDETRRRLADVHRRLLDTIGGLDDARLEDRVPGKDQTLYVMLHGVVQHDLYHAGQIALLKRATAAAA